MYILSRNFHKIISCLLALRKFGNLIHDLADSNMIKSYLSRSFVTYREDLYYDTEGKTGCEFLKERSFASCVS